MFAILLPLVGVTALQMQAPLSDAEVEAALLEGVRAKLADGWRLVEASGDYEEITLTLEKVGEVERHVVHVDHDLGNAYRIEAGGTPAPAPPTAPSAFLVQALRSGRIAIGGDCGRLELVPYLVEAHAKGAAAGRLVAKLLKTSDDVEQIYVADNAAQVTLDFDGKHVQLEITLDDDDRVIAAEVRRYEYDGPDDATYTDHARMRRHIGTTVTKIVDDGVGVTLSGSKRYVIESSAFERDSHADDGCGC